MGVSVQNVFNTLQVYMGSMYVNNFNEFDRSWQVKLQADGRFRRVAAQVGQLKVRNAAGQMVPLNTVTRLEDVNGPVMVTRYNMYPAAAINGNVAPGISSGQGIQLMERLAAAALPEKMTTEWTELTYMQILAGNHGRDHLRAGRGAGVSRAGRAVRKLVAAAGRDPGGADVPVVLDGGRGAGPDGREHLHADRLRGAGGAGQQERDSDRRVRPPATRNRATIAARPRLEACRLRLRPIMMTSLAFILGVVPLVMAHGAGAEMRRTLGTAVFSGMLGVTLFGIFLTPVFFYVIDWLTTQRRHE